MGGVNTEAGDDKIPAVENGNEMASAVDATSNAVDATSNAVDGTSNTVNHDDAENSLSSSFDYIQSPSGEKQPRQPPSQFKL